ncbi:MAG: TldD/PmbA family protein [Chloroflexi bacterium]|nr:TldD/PmbA family protein [Chloroflexota bacterium]
MEEILKKALMVAEDAEVYRTSSEITSVSFESKRLKHLHTWQSEGIALRLIKDGKLGLSSTRDPRDVDGLVRRALEVASLGAKAKLELPSQDSFSKVEIFDPALEAMPVETMAELGQSLMEAVLSYVASGLVYARDIQCDVGVGKTISSVEIINSQGAEARYRKSTFSLDLEGTLVRGTDMLFVGEGQSFCKPIPDFRPLARSVQEQLELAKEIAIAPTGEAPVIFTPRGVASVFLMPLVVAFNGKTVLQGASPVGSKLGQRLCDERFSLWDDPTAPHAVGSRPSDDEAIPSRRTELIAKGVTANFLYDLQTAALAGARSTGSAVRSLGSMPSPSPSVLFIDGGDASLEDMLAEIKEGIVVERLLGAGQGNVLGGDFNGNVLLGYKVENGRIVGRVKDTMIHGNVYDVLNNIIAIGRETRWVGGSVCTPALCCRGVSVARRS